MRNLDTSKHNISYPFTSNTTTTTTTPSPAPHKHPHRNRLTPILILSGAVLISAILILAGPGAGLLSSLFGNKTRIPPLAASQGVGHIFFMSSGQINEHTSQGIADEIELDLSNIASPAPGKSYYAWLLNDDPAEGKALLLGQLSVNHGAVYLHYSGDPQHTNLLEVADRLLVTEEDASTVPNLPSLDTSTWRYMAQIPQIPNPSDAVHHYSLLNHLRHLLASDPTLELLDMPGGLDIWLFRNVQKVLEWSGSARDDWTTQGTGLMHRQFIRVLDYLDGLSYVQNDVPPGTPVLVDTRIARASLLEFNVQQQEPPGLLYHIGLHLQGLVGSPGATAQQKQLAIQIDTAINKVNALLQGVRQDARRLVMMTDAQLLQPSSLSILDDMVKQAQDAFVGQFDPTTGEIENGVTQIHYAIQRLATLDVTVVPASHSGPPQGLPLQTALYKHE
ncbi:MAG: hypothetical protein JOZ18_05085 [Chloroflexi bacterium]|nr:hypothetical protein [Chloroflexota bacterium]